MDEVLSQWRERIVDCAASGTSLRIVGGASKDFYGQELQGDLLDTRAFNGIVDYDPAELVVTARGGTRLAELESTLAGGGQMLAFEPPHFGEQATVGGCLATGLAGPRRPYGGSVRDLALGVRMLDGRGQDLSFGGRVMKNVAGFDVSRLIIGSMGTLGIIVEASIKCLPLPRAEKTRVFEKSAQDALRSVNQWAGAPLPLSATCWHDGHLYVRLSGAESALTAAIAKLGGEPLDQAGRFWADVRDQRHVFFDGLASSDAQSPLWRLSVQSTAPFERHGGEQMIEWGGALRWLRGTEPDAVRLRAWAEAHGGHATLFRSSAPSDRSVPVFHPLARATMGLNMGIKQAFDPAGVFNPRRMHTEF